MARILYGRTVWRQHYSSQMTTFLLLTALLVVSDHEANIFYQCKSTSVSPASPSSTRYFEKPAFDCESGSCYITIETSGSSPPPVISTTPLALRVMGELIAQICPKDEGGDGGFHTFRFQKLIEWSYTGALESGGWRSPPPVDAAFFTVTVSGTAKTFAPGNTDPGVPAQLVLVSEKTPPLPHNAWYIFEDLKQFWWKRSLQMVRGGKEPWW